MRTHRTQSVSGHIYLKRRQKGPVWYWRIRLPNGGEERKAIGPEWAGNGRPPSGHYTRRTAQAALEARLTDLRRGVGIPERTGATFADAAEGWYSNGSTGEPDWKPSTRRDYRSALDRHLLPAFGPERLEEIDTAAIEAWRTRAMANGLPRRTAAKLTAILHGIFKRARKAYGLRINPVDDVEPLRLRYDPARYDFYSPSDVWALVRAASSEQDGALFLTAAFTGMRMGELLALRVRDADFEASALRIMGAYDHRGGLGTTKGGRGRSVPMVAEVAQTLAKLLQREHFTGRDDLVFPGETGGFLDGSALRRRYRSAQARAGLRRLRFHDLRHSFGSLAITRSSTRDVQEWLGHADSRTTARYVHYRSRAGEAEQLGGAFRIEQPQREEVPS